MWGGTVLSSIFLMIRVAARWKHFHRLYVDDALVALAWLMVLTTTSLWQVQAEHLYQLISVITGKLIPPPSIKEDTEHYLKAVVGVYMLFYSTLWTVKLAFLLFFRRLSENVAGQQKLWWGVTAFTVATYIVCIGTLEYKCLTNSFEYVSQKCTAPSVIKYELDTLKVNTAFDVLTDYLSAIQTVPIAAIRIIDVY